MGGNALSFETRRINRQEYDRIVTEITNKFSSLHGKEGVITDIPFYTEKKDFGDIDFLIISDLNDRKKWIQETFKPKEIYHNSNVFSFDYDGVQIDFIFSKKEEFAISLYYFSFNDLGNLIGRVYHKMGLSFGHDGLKLILRDKSYVIAETILSRNIDEILEFGGYDPERYHQGFDSLESIFEFVVSSPYYAYEIFDLDNRNYRARVRDRKRKTYTEFLKWAEQRDQTHDYQWGNNKAAWLPSILLKFNKLDWFNEEMLKHKRRIELKEKFNGDVVSEVTKLQDKELGSFIASFRKVYKDSDLEKMSEQAIKNAIQEFFDKWDSQ